MSWLHLGVPHMAAANRFPEGTAMFDRMFDMLRSGTNVEILELMQPKTNCAHIPSL